MRLAVRTMSFMTRLPNECLPKPLHEFDPVTPPVLPPELVDVINYIYSHGGGAFKQTIWGAARTIMAYAPINRQRYPALQRVWATFPELEFEAEWKIEQAAHVETAAITTPAHVDAPTLTIN